VRATHSEWGEACYTQCYRWKGGKDDDDDDDQHHHVFCRLVGWFGGDGKGWRWNSTCVKI